MRRPKVDVVVGEAEELEIGESLERIAPCRLSHTSGEL
jgi:hypothetical protein